MQKKIIVIYFLFITSVSTSFSQNKFNVGVNYTGGISKIVGNDIQYLFKSSFGIGCEAEYNFSSHSSILLSTGYLQLGSKFNDEVDNQFNPIYKLEYWNAQLFYKYNLNPNRNKLNHFIELGMEENTLLSAATVNTYGSINIKNNINAFSYGLVAGIGTAYIFKMYGSCRLTLIGSYGLNTIYKASMLENGFSGNNLFIGLKGSYLFENCIKKEN